MSDRKIAMPITWQNKNVKPRQSVIHYTHHKVSSTCNEPPVTLCGRTIPGYSWKPGEVLADDWESWSYLVKGPAAAVPPARFCKKCEAKSLEECEA